MTIPASDIDALFDLIEEGGTKLRKQNPDHELLQFLAPVMQEAPWTDEVSEKFLAKFDPDDKKTAVTIRVAYLHALNEANNAPPADTRHHERNATSADLRGGVLCCSFTTNI